ncbi:hypothetical protein RIVM261_081860 [Rivularia sp. IAM M-261]|nr:hypothetical protein RIVM261_081860 [Rivularia sp. IAM M-261]
MKGLQMLDLNFCEVIVDEEANVRGGWRTIDVNQYPVLLKANLPTRPPKEVKDLIAQLKLLYGRNH